jgi:hypothetical protein
MISPPPASAHTLHRWGGRGKGEKGMNDTMFPGRAVAWGAWADKVQENVNTRIENVRVVYPYVRAVVWDPHANRLEAWGCGDERFPIPSGELRSLLFPED